MSDDPTPPMARPRVAAGALFFDEQGRVLLVKPTYKDGWDIPGGYVEPGETPREACEREILEELGLKTLMGRLLVVDWAPSESEGDKLLFVFDGGAFEAESSQLVRLPHDELTEWRLYPLTVLRELMPMRLARRIARAVAARDDGSVLYLEHGSVPGLPGD